MREFNDFYEEVIKPEEIELEKLKKEQDKKVGFIFLMLFTIFLLSMFISIFSVLFIFVIGYIIKTFKSSNYIKEFKKRIIEKMVLEFKEFDKFIPESGISEYTYKMAEFEGFDTYKSEDFISGHSLGKYPLQISEVHTEKVYTDSDGNTSTKTMFHGLFAQIKIPIKINGYVHIHSDKGFFSKIFGGKDKIEMDSSEFEQTFDVRATDKILAMQVLTSDVMDALLNFINQYKIQYEITVKESNLFIRFKTGLMFEPKSAKITLEKQSLKKYYEILQFIIKVSEEITKSIERTK